MSFNAETELPPFVGNTIRGALGSALDRMGSPAFEQVFKIDATESMPNPYTISVPYPAKAAYKPGDTLEFSVVLFGIACDYGLHFAVAARDMCRGKLKNCALDGLALEFDRVWSDEGAESIAPCDKLTLTFVTPTEILNIKQAARKISFDTFIDSLFGRICGIIDNYTDGEFVIPYALSARKPFITAEYDTRSVNFQTNGQPVNGFLGTVRYRGDITRYLPYIDLGSQLHIGKKTTRACGEYNFEF